MRPGTNSTAMAPITTTTMTTTPTTTSTKETLQAPTAAWNTHNLSLRLCADVSAAATAGALVAPVITAIDKAIIENASGRQTLGRSLRASFTTLCLRPHHFFLSKPFALIFALYSGTYVTANLLDTSQSTIHATPAKSTTSGSAKFIATSSANLSLCLYKDSRFAKLFGAATASPRPIPTPSYALFAVRDCLTVFASFNLPPLLAPMLPLSHQMQKHCSALSAAQFIAPAAVQLLSTPLHLLGLDLYNRHARLGFGDRFAKVGRDWLKSSLARMARIVPAFGVGGVVNTRVRASLMERLE
jgi:hypothetical protein